MSEKKQRYDLLQFYRAAATLFVMLYHWTACYDAIEPTSWAFRIERGGYLV